jgi:hypothetical protein
MVDPIICLLTVYKKQVCWYTEFFSFFLIICCSVNTGSVQLLPSQNPDCSSNKIFCVHMFNRCLNMSAYILDTIQCRLFVCSFHTFLLILSFEYLLLFQCSSPVWWFLFPICHLIISKSFPLLDFHHISETQYELFLFFTFNNPIFNSCSVTGPIIDLVRFCISFETPPS